MSDSSSVASDLAALLAKTVQDLERMNAPEESLGVLRQPRRFSLLPSVPVMEPAGRVWRLGVLLIDRDGHLYSTGEVTRAIEPLRAVTNRSHEAELRRDDRRAASRGKFPTGEVVNHLFAPIALDAASLEAGSGPLSIVDGAVMVRWDTSPNTGTGNNGVSRLDAYLKDRMSLLFLD